MNINETTFGSIANYSCQTGYVLNGTSERVCEEDGQWTDLMLQCTRKLNNYLYCYMQLNGKLHVMTNVNSL